MVVTTGKNVLGHNHLLLLVSNPQIVLQLNYCCRGWGGGGWGVPMSHVDYKKW